MPHHTDESGIQFTLTITGTLPPLDGVTAYEVKINIPSSKGSPYYAITGLRGTQNRKLCQLIERRPGGYTRELRPLCHPFTANGSPEDIKRDYYQICAALESHLLDHEARQKKTAV